MTSKLIVVTGANGQLGRSLSKRWAESPLPGHQLKALDRAQWNLTQAEYADAVLSALKPSVIVNAAAYTQVDRAETESDEAFLVNGKAVNGIATWAARNGAKLIHISTDFVFDGAGKTPYKPDNHTGPLGVYGASKLEGERAVQEAAPSTSAIIRTSWLYSEYGNNFVKTMLRLMTEKEQLSVVKDQIGSPTSTHGLATLIFDMIRKDDYQGIYHWSDGASISWFEFAQEIQNEAMRQGLLRKAIDINPIETSEYPTPAKRPRYSVLDRERALAEFDCPSEDWKEQLSLVIEALNDNE